MLDITSIPVVDNHCHPVLLNQHMDALRFRSYCTEATDPSFAEKHVPNTVYYLWLLRQMATFYGCERNEDDILAARSRLGADTLLEHLLRAANIDTLVLDPAYPLSSACYTPERMGQLGHCRAVKMLRLETLMQELILDYSDFDEVIERFADRVRHVHEHGYCALKSIVAYRTGLNIAEWSKDEAAASFLEARTQASEQGQLRIAHKPLIDYLLHIAFQQAAEQQLPIQFHTGYGDSDTDMRLGNPLQLREVLERKDYHSMAVVLLHESYPYCQLGAYLAAIYPHVYFDLSYTIPFLDKLEMLAFTRQALSVAPASKLMFSTDGIHLPEMHWAGALRGRSIIGQVLDEMIDADEIDEDQGYDIAQQILHDTAYAVYKL
ncbi:MAG TPA: amidohydrolase family protein [Ktedonobacteraceae bacterium]|nr:amidohydrolase family protein [Ktedonobacteraceae bacterium]